MHGQMSVSWSRYCLAIGALNCVPLLLAIANGGLDSNLAIVWLVLLSVCAFMGFGWARLQREHAIRPLTIMDMDRARRLLIGPLIPAVVWFALTMVAAIALAIATA